jgi:hypothetical protein
LKFICNLGFGDWNFIHRRIAGINEGKIWSVRWKNISGLV